MGAVLDYGICRRVLPRTALLWQGEQGMNFPGAPQVSVKLRSEPGSFWLHPHGGRSRDVINRI
jgi:hypothetical protein